MEYDLKERLPTKEMEGWVEAKKGGSELMDLGDQFGVRPLEDRTVAYCVGDVVMLPMLREVYEGRFGEDEQGWMEKVKEESERRVAEACSVGYQPEGWEKKYGPWGKVGDVEVGVVGDRGTVGGEKVIGES